MLNSRPRMGTPSAAVAAQKIEQVSRWLICLILVTAPLFGGTADRPYTLLFAAASALACLLTLIRRRSPLPPPLLSWFHIWLSAAWAFTLLQTLPLPPAWRDFLAPGSAEALHQITAGLAPPGRYLALSLDVGATLHEAVRLGGYACLLFALTELFAANGTTASARLLGQMVYAAAALCAGLGFLSGLGVALPAPIAIPGGGATRALFPAGLYNSNHMASLVGLGALFILADLQAMPQRLADWAQRGKAAGLYGLWLLCNLVLVGTLSRAGIAVFGAAQLLLGFWQSGQRRQRLWPSLLGGLLSLGLGLALWGSLFSALRQRLLEVNWTTLNAPGGKFFAWQQAWPLLRGHLWFGVGRGAFENAFQHVQALSGRMRFVYLENEWLQTFVDWGLVPGLILCGLLLRAVLAAWKSQQEFPQRPFAAAALVGLLALALSNLFDFNLQVGGVAISAVALCALVQRLSFRFSLARFWAIGLGLLTLCGAALVALYFPSHDEDGARLRALCMQPASSLAQVQSAGQAAVLRHPFDAYLSALVATRLGAAHHPLAVRFINRALLANPHDVLGRHAAVILLFAQKKRPQALLLLRATLADADGEMRKRLLQTLVENSQDSDEMLAALPDPLTTIELLNVLGTNAVQNGRAWPLVQSLSIKALHQQPHLQAAAVWLGRAALARHDGAAADAAARALLETFQGSDLPALLFADLVELLAKAAPALVGEQLAQKALGQGERPEILLALGRLTAERGAHAEAKELLNRALKCTAANFLRARIHEVYGDLEAAAGNLHQATLHRVQAAKLRSATNQ